jgi:hypothetical protein
MTHSVHGLVIGTGDSPRYGPLQLKENPQGDSDNEISAPSKFGHRPRDFL